VGLVFCQNYQEDEPECGAPLTNSEGQDSKSEGEEEKVCLFLDENDYKNGNLGGNILGQGQASGESKEKTVSAGVDAKAHASAQYKGDFIEADIRTEAYAQAQGEATLDANGLSCKGGAKFGVSATTKGKVNVFGNGEGPAIEGYAKVSNEVVVQGELSIGKNMKCEADVKFGPMAEAGTSFGTEENSVGFKVSAGGAKAKTQFSTKVNEEEETMQLRFAGGANLGIGGELSVSTKIYNPVNKGLREDFASGDASRMIGAGLDVVNPTKMAANAFGFKDEAEPEEDLVSGGFLVM